MPQESVQQHIEEAKSPSTSREFLDRRIAVRAAVGDLIAGADGKPDVCLHPPGDFWRVDWHEHTCRGKAFLTRSRSAIKLAAIDDARGHSAGQLHSYTRQVRIGRRMEERGTPDAPVIAADRERDYRDARIEPGDCQTAGAASGSECPGDGRTGAGGDTSIEDVAQTIRESLPHQEG